MKKSISLLTLIFSLFLVFIGYGQCDPIPTTLNIESVGDWQIWTVPSGVTSLTIEAAGAQGGRFQTSPGNFRTGGKGARYICTIPVTPGEELALIVGTKGADHPGTHSGQGAGGGGGTFIAHNTLGLHSFNTEDYILAVGGGGGAGSTQTGLDAINESMAEVGSPGIFGSGVYTAGGGGALTLDGFGGTQPDGGGDAASHGGSGGRSVDFAPIDTSFELYVDGGFGGGGAGGGSGGGGGGFSGGSAGPLVSQGGFGAGSKINNAYASSVSFFPGDNTGHGFINISYDAPFVDITPPTITCPATITVTNDPGSCNASNVDFGEITIDDNCAGATLSNDAPPSGMFPLGDTIVTHTVTDFYGNTAACTQTITVIDNEDPTISCPGNITQNNEPGNCGAFVTFNVTATDNCGGTMTQTSGLSSGEFFPIGVTTNSFLFTDDSGNTATCTFNVTIINAESVIAICQDITVQLNSSGNASIDPQDVDGGSTTPCSPTNLSVDTTTFTASDLGENNVQLTVSNQAGTISTCTAVVTVEDILPPTAICQNITIPLDATGNASIVATDIDNGSFDNANDISLNADITTFNCEDIGENLVTLTVTDGSGNSSTCEAIVTIVGLSAICQDITIQLDENDMATINANQINNGSLSFGCGNVTLSLDNDTFNCSDIGPNSVELTVTDTNGNTDSCTATVTVISNGIVDAVCQDITVALDNTGEVSVTLEQLIEDPGCDTTIDFVPSNLITQNIFNDTYELSNVGQSFTATESTDLHKIKFAGPVNAQFQIGSILNVRIYNGPDGSLTVGNDPEDAAYFQNVMEFDFIIYDTDGIYNYYELTLNEPFPVIQGEEYSFIFQKYNQLILAVNLLNEGYTDGTYLHDFNVRVEWLDLFFELVFIPRTTFYCDDVGLQTIDFIATDSLGNTSTCTASINVEENSPPTASCQNITVALDSTGNASITAADVDDGSSDACGSVTSTINISSFNCSNIGANDVILTVTDSSGNTDTCTAVVTVEDNSVPLVVCQDITIQLDAAGNASITANDVNGGSSDACGIASLEIDNDSFTCADIGENIVMLTVTDINGNTNACSSTVTVEDNVPPIAVCMDITVQLDASGNASIVPADVDGGSTDNCGIDTFSIDIDTFDCANVGPNNVTLTVTDVNGNMSSCIAVVTIEDSMAPTINCVADTTLNTNGEPCEVLVIGNFLDATFTDNCDSATITNDFNGTNTLDQDYLPVGMTTVVWTVNDGNGQTATCTTVITVVDNDAPVSVCQDITVLLDATGNASIIGADVDGGSFDDCGIASLSVSPSSFTCADVGPNTVTLTVTDVNGNSSTCSSTVTVEDAPPAAVCQDITIQLDANGDASIVAADVDGGSTDNCGIASLAVDVDTFDCSNVGPNNVTLTVTDVNGNSSSCTAIVTVEETIPPTLFCPADIVASTNNGECGAIVTFVTPVGTDNCGIDFVVQQAGIASGEVFPVGVTTNQFIVVDLSGNTATCSFTVTVVDDDAPIAVCQDITVMLDVSGNASIVAADVDGGSTDNCGITSLSIDIGSFSCADLGDNIVTLTATDAGGLSSSCTAIVTVQNGVMPNAVCQDATVQLDALGMVTITDASIFDGGSTDACGGTNLTFSVSPDTFTCAELGDNTVTVTVTDDGGNTSTCSATITVEDVTAPTVSCTDATVSLDANGMASIDPAALVLMSDDACGVTTISADIVDFDCDDVGTPVLVTVMVEDASGNSATCTATVTVLDELEPQFVSGTLPVDEMREADENGAYILEDFTTDVIVTDNCSLADLPIVLDQDPAIGTVLTVGVYDITLSAEDDLGNIAEYVFELTVSEFLNVSENSFDIVSITMFPNPATDFVMLSNPQHIPLKDVAIYDVTGRLIKTIDASEVISEIRIDTSELASATYMILITTEAGQVTKQMVKE